MKRVSFLLALIFTAWWPAWAEGPDDLYIQIYNSLQQADTLNQAGQYRSAAEKYRDVQSALKNFQIGYPNWNQKIINYRLNYVSERLASLQKFLQPQAVRPTNPEGPGKKIENKSETSSQVQALNAEIRRLESEKSNLEAKLREALSVQSGNADSTRMEEKIASLEKERDLLKVAVEQAKLAQKTNLVESLPADLKKIKELEQERDALQKKLEMNAKEQAAQTSRHDAELKLAEKKIKQLEDLDEKREALEQQLKETLNAALDGNFSKGDQKKLKKLEQEKADLENKFGTISQELIGLQTERERRIKDHQAALNRVKELENERDELQKRVRAAESSRPEERAELARENLQLRSRMEAYEARPTPFTAEELALFKKPETPSVPKSFFISTKMTKDLSSRERTLVNEADKAFASQSFEVAEKKYEQVINGNDKNVYTLANLASTQIELNRVTEAEQNLKRALTVDPNDAFSLLLLGKIKMNQNKFDEALDALSRSAQINPNSAETQNYLGIVMSEKGQRVSAEAALRKAIQIQPDYASAHHNLSIIYATQKPPFVELARWHYEKALALGHSKNSDLEKLIEEK